MAGDFQPLVNSQRIVNPDGTPNEYFIRWAQQRQIDIGNGVTAEQVLAIVVEFAADHPLSAGSGILFTPPSGDINDNIAISAKVQEILDQITTTRGTILFRGATAWQALAPGTVGDFLKTNGAGADPVWATVSSGGGGSPPFLPPAASLFPVLVNAPTITDNATYGTIMTGATNAGIDRFALHTFSTNVYSIKARIINNCFDDFNGVGIIFRRASDGAYLRAYTYMNAGQLRYQYVNNGAASADALAAVLENAMFMRLDYNRTTGAFSALISKDGVNWRTWGTGVAPTAMDQVGLRVGSYNTTQTSQGVCTYYSDTDNPAAV